MRRNNTSGYIGVNWSKEKNKWHAKIGLNGRRIHIGYFEEITDAAKMYAKWKKKILRERIKCQHNKKSES